MSVELVFIALDFAGIALFAASGGIVAARKGLDPFGAAVIGVVTGMGGGTIRDLILGRLPVYWVEAPEYLALAVMAGVIGYYGSELVRGETGRRRQALVWADAAGLSVFSVLGAQAGLTIGAHWSIALVTGVLSASFGGLLRDVIVNDVPLVLREDIYALAALLGAVSYVLAITFNVDAGIAAVFAALCAFTLRGLAIVFKWSLPSIGRVD